MSKKTKTSGARIELPREEYDAFCYLRDVTYQDALAKAERFERLVEQLDLLGKQSKHVINEQSITIEHLREKLLQQHELIMKMQSRLQALEPVKSQIAQPAFSRK